MKSYTNFNCFNASFFLLLGLFFFIISCQSNNNNGSYLDSSQLKTQSIIIVDVDTMIASKALNKSDDCPPNCAYPIIIDVDTMYAANIKMLGTSKSIQSKGEKLGSKSQLFYRLPILKGKDTVFVLLPKNQFDAVIKIK